jgi:hypothetical protein
LKEGGEKKTATGLKIQNFFNGLPALLSRLRARRARIHRDCRLHIILFAGKTWLGPAGLWWPLIVALPAFNERTAEMPQIDGNGGLCAA